MVYSSELWRLFHLLMLFRLQSFRAKWNLKSLPTLIRGSWLCFCCLLQSHVRLFCDPMGCGLGFPDGSSGKEHTCRKHERCRFDPWVRKIPWRRSWQPTPVFLGFPGISDGKESACKVGDLGSIPGLGRSPGERNSYPLQYSRLKNSMERGAWQATVHGVTKSQTQLSDFHFHNQISGWVRRQWQAVTPSSPGRKQETSLETLIAGKRPIQHLKESPSKITWSPGIEQTLFANPRNTTQGILGMQK